MPADSHKMHMHCLIWISQLEGYPCWAKKQHGTHLYREKSPLNHFFFLGIFESVHSLQRGLYMNMQTLQGAHVQKST